VKLDKLLSKYKFGVSDKGLSPSFKINNILYIAPIK